MNSGPDVMNGAMAAAERSQRVFRSSSGRLKDMPAQTATVWAGEVPGAWGGGAEPRERAARGGRGRRDPGAAPSPAGGAAPRSWTETNTAVSGHDVTHCLPAENFLESLPSEVLMKILSYLDASSLVCISHVSRLLHRLADDQVVWQSIYVSEFGDCTWRSKSPEAEWSPALHWKRLYFLAMGGSELSSWRAECHHVSASTGLPRNTQRFLRNMKVTWELTVRDVTGWEMRAEPSHAHFSESALMLSWSGNFPRYESISCIQLHGVRKQLDSRPGWRTLIRWQDMRIGTQFLGKDRSVRVMLLSPGFVIGVWRGESSVAFIMLSLHLHRLVEECLLGSLAWQYLQPASSAVGDSDPELGLHGYTLHFSLHTTASDIMKGTFCQLSFIPDAFRLGLLRLSAIHSRQLSQHRPLSGDLRLNWRSTMMEGSVKNCCFMTLTLLDQFHKPFWCVSAPVWISRARHPQMLDYNGDDFVMKYRDQDGEVKLALVWLEEPHQFFLVSLVLYISVAKVNEHFSTQYNS